jgi:hypothetical protein
VLFQIYQTSSYASRATSANDCGASTSSNLVQPSELQRKSDEWVIKWMFVDAKDAKNFERQTVLMQYAVWRRALVVCLLVLLLLLLLLLL